MKSIDFLPERYRERDLKRKAALWQYALAAGFGGLLLAATIGQISIKRSLQADLAKLNPSSIQTQMKRARVKALKQQLGNSEQSAALYTYLRHPWPRTQLIIRITEILPENVELQGIEIVAQRPSSSPSNTNTGDPSDETAPAASDLAELRSNYDATQLVVRVRGTVDDTAALNGYVKQLGEVPLFRSVSLGSLQTPQSRGETPRSVFELHVVVCPGHGQPGGPKSSLAEREKIARNLARRPVQ